MQTTYSNDDLSMHLEEESSKPDIDLSKILTSEKDVEGSHQAGRSSGINSTLMEESHHVKVRTTYSNNDPSMHSEEEPCKPERSLSKILTSEKDVEGSHKAGSISGMNSIHMEEFHRIEIQTTSSNSDPSKQVKEDSGKSDIESCKRLNLI